MKFPSQEWADAFRSALNANEEYAEAARGWEGDVLFLVVPEAPSDPSPGIHLDLFQGFCRGATFVPDGRGVASEFVYEGRRSDWERLMRRELDPVKAILEGTFRLRGNAAKALRFVRAAKALVETAASVPTQG